VTNPPPPPSDRVPDAISAEALRVALGKGFPEATALQPFAFGDSAKHEGCHDLVVLLATIFSQDDGGPAVVQIIHALAYLSWLLEDQIRTADATQRQAIEKVIEEQSGIKALAARMALKSIASDMEQTFEQLRQLRLASDGLCSDAMQAQAAMEIMSVMGANTPHPSDRKRHVSDRLLDSIGIDREAFDSYFNRRTAE
jgi:hypothetical protein